ncbi:MAG: ABC transporter permease [Ilumatobacteraceae bacterium]
MIGAFQRVRSERTTTQLQLVVRLARRQIAQRYRESLLGGAWALLNPLILLGLYWFIFAKVFESSWIGPESTASYALLIYSGIVIFTLFSEIANNATNVVQNNSLLIKRTTVSARVLPLASSLASVFTFALNSVPFLIMFVLLEGKAPPATAFLTPVLVLLLLTLATGIGMIIASIAAYFRDVQQVVPLLTTATLFLSPIFYPLDELPPNIRGAMEYLTPLGIILPASKKLLFLGEIPSLWPLVGYAIVAVVVFVIGWSVYGVASRGFSDVV